MPKFVIILSLLLISLYGDTAVAEKNTTSVAQEIAKKRLQGIKDAQNIIERQDLIKRKEQLDEDINENNIWLKIYSNYRTYEKLKDQEGTLKKDIKRLENFKSLTKKQEKQLENYKNEQKTVVGKLQLLKEYEKDPFEKLLKHDEIEESPSIGNPIAVLNAISYQKKLNSDLSAYKERYKSLILIVDKLQEEQNIIKRIIALDENNLTRTEHQKQLESLDRKFETFNDLLEIFETTKNVYDKKVEEISLNLNKEIKGEIEKTLMIISIIAFFVVILFMLKLLTKRYMHDDDRTYRVNKALNMMFFAVLIFILLFSYIENVSYLVTVLSFASAGIAIAMKDWFMNMLGWLVLVISGSIRINV